MEIVKTQKGITLLGLLIMIIIVLLILSLLLKNGSADNKVGDITIVEAQSDVMLEKTTNSITYDDFGNKIVIPAGFKILVDSTTGYSSTNLNVTKGIVITDKINQFVWVPVGNIKTSTTDKKGTTITLARYNFVSVTGEPKQYVGEYTEDTPINHNSSYCNSIARNINDFIESANENCGYYIGRYEAGRSGSTLVCNAGETAYTNVTQQQASRLSQEMYHNGYKTDGTGTFSSDLVNSYAWDTAIVFIQTFGGKEAIKYSNTNRSTTYTTTGNQPNGDEFCNINDMSGNMSEWTTETSNDTEAPCVRRGGSGEMVYGKSSLFTSFRSVRS